MCKLPEILIICVTGRSWQPVRPVDSRQVSGLRANRWLRISGNNCHKVQEKNQHMRWRGSGVDGNKYMKMIS